MKKLTLRRIGSHGVWHVKGVEGSVESFGREWIPTPFFGTATAAAAKIQERNPGYQVVIEGSN